MNNIKDYRNKELLWYIIAQIVLIVIFQNPGVFYFDLANWQETLIRILTSTVFSSAIGVFAFIFDSMFGDSLKRNLLYFGKRSPGEKVFEDIKDKNFDYRYTKERALEKYRDVYKNMPDSKTEKKVYENDKWYQIYAQYRNVPMIYNSHRDFLLCRDIYFSTIVINVLYGLMIVLLKDVTFVWQYFVLEIVFLLCSNIATRQKGEKFVKNVIAYDLQE